MSTLGAELSMVILSFLIYIVYHVWLFKGSGRHLRTAELDTHGSSRDMFHKGNIARCEFSESVCRDDDTILGIQQNRNCLLGAAFLATTVSLLAQNILNVLLDADQLDQIRQYGEQDPLTDGLEIPPVVVLGINFVLLMCSLLAFAHAVRLFVHGGYFFKAGAMAGQGWVSIADVAEVAVQAQVAQSLGMRTLFFFPVTAMWLIGPTAMIIAAVITTAAVAFVDRMVVHDVSYTKLLQKLDARSEQLIP